jgi:Zn-dependent protease with chaperone function
MNYVPGPATSALLLIFLLILPVALTLHLRRNALTAPPADRTAAWFAFVRSLHWTVIGALVLWWAATDFVGLRGYTLAAAEALGWGDAAAQYVLSIFLCWLPILLVMVFCSVLSQPVYAGVRGLTWTRGELAKLSLLRMGVSYVPLILFLASFGILDSSGLPDWLLCYGGAFAIYLVSLRLLRTAIQWKPEALTSGDLRDRAFALAANLGVKLKQIYIVPAGKMQMANAFASSANTVLLTDYLIAQLNRREVDAIVAHELAHIKHKHAQTRGAITGVLGAGIAIWYGASGDTSWLRLPVPRPLLEICFCWAFLFALYFLSRRFEFTADREGARLTGDPEALITGLAKVHALNAFPVRWGKWTDKTMTHPSTSRRAEAIAEATGYPVERVPILLESAESSTDANPPDRYVLPEHVHRGTKVFSTEFKRRFSWRVYLTSLGTMVLVPAVLVRAMDATGWPLPGWVIFAAAAIVCVLCRWLLLSFVTWMGTRRLTRLLRAKFRQEGIAPDAWEGVVVGFSPDANVRVYDGSYSWDMGYLFLTSDRLCYWGEAMRFALKRDQIIAVQLGPGAPGWFQTPSVLVTWSNAATGKQETFRVSCGESALSLRGKHNRALARWIQAWNANENVAASWPQLPADLGPPAVGATTSIAVIQLARPNRFVWSIMMMGFFAGCACAILGIPVDVTSPIAHGFGLAGPDKANQLGWYAVFATWVVLVLSFAPFWIYRDAKPATPVRLHETQTVPESK